MKNTGGQISFDLRRYVQKGRKLPACFSDRSAVCFYLDIIRMKCLAARISKATLNDIIAARCYQYNRERKFIGLDELL